jgi:hypothetical protein
LARGRIERSGADKADDWHRRLLRMCDARPASRFIARSCSTSTRNTFISMSNSFSSRRMTGSGSGASHGLGPEIGLEGIANARENSR